MIDSIISSDAHIVEPPGVWTDRMPGEARAPRIERVAATPGLGATGEFADYWCIDGKPVMPVFNLNPGERLEQGGGKNLPIEGIVEEMRDGEGLAAYEPERYVLDLDKDNVLGTVVYPTCAISFYRLEDGVLISAIARAYNDFIAEYCRAVPKRLKGAAMINVDDPGEAAAEIQRCAAMGIATAMLPVAPLADRPYSLPIYDPVWAALQDTQMPVTFHVGTNRASFTDNKNLDSTHIALATSALQDNFVRKAFADMIFGGAFVRYPGLQIVAAEFELGWIPFFLARLDYAYTQRRRRLGWVEFPNGMVPSDFWRQNGFVSFQEDLTIRGEAWQAIGTDKIMFGTDFPHTESTYPHSVAIADKVLAELSEADKELICQTTTKRLFGFDEL